MLFLANEIGQFEHFLHLECLLLMVKIMNIFGTHAFVILSLNYWSTSDLKINFSNLDCIIS